MTATATPIKAQLAALTGIRALAALWVFALHARGILYSFIPQLERADAVLKMGYYGVDLFFVLSGFILAYNYRDELAANRRGIGRFLWRRFARIWPVHVFALVAVWWYIGWNFSDSSGSYSRESMVWHVLLLNVFEPTLTWNYVAWSASAEWLLYLAFPVLVVVAMDAKGHARTAAIVALGVLVPLSLHGWQFGEWLTLDVWRAFGAFALGLLLHEAYAARWREGAPWGIIGALGLAAVVWIGIDERFGRFVLLPYAALIMSCAYARGPLAWIFATRPATWLGERSYSLYMLHSFVLTLLWDRYQFGRAAVTLDERIGAAAGYLLAVVGVAALTYALVEDPARRLLYRARWPRWRARADATAQEDS